MKAENYSKTLKSAVNEASTLSERSSDSELKTLASNISSSFNESNQHMESTNAALTKENSYREAYSRIESMDTSFGIQLQQDFVDYLSETNSPQEVAEILQNPEVKQQEISKFIEGYSQNLFDESKFDKSNITDGYYANKNEVANDITTSKEKNSFEVKGKAKNSDFESKTLEKHLQKDVDGRISDNSEKIKTNIGEKQQEFSKESTLHEGKIKQEKSLHTLRAAQNGIRYIKDKF